MHDGQFDIVIIAALESRDMTINSYYQLEEEGESECHLWRKMRFKCCYRPGPCMDTSSDRQQK